MRELVNPYGPLIVSDYWTSSKGSLHTSVIMTSHFGVNDKELYSCPVTSCQFNHGQAVEVSEEELKQGTLCCNGLARFFEPVGE